MAECCANHALFAHAQVKPTHHTVNPPLISPSLGRNFIFNILKTKALFRILAKV